jgi:hypothetical protein
MEHVVVIDEDTAKQQSQLKQSLVNLIMNENTFISKVDFINVDDSPEASLKIDYIAADSVELS